MIHIFQSVKKFFSANALFFYILVVLLCGAIFANAFEPFAEDTAIPRTIEFSVHPGMSVRAIALELENEQIIKSRHVLRLYGFFTGRADSFQPGTYNIHSGQSVREIVAILTAGPIEVEVLVAPGMTMIEIEDILVANRVLGEGDLTGFPVSELRERYPFLGDSKILEGFLFPDTYRFYPHSDPAVVVGKFLDNFDTKITALLAGLPCSRSWQVGGQPPSAECQDSLQGLHNPENNDTIHWLILASILEKEVTNEHEAQIVAGIMEKRLAIGMPLQVDASIIYAKCKRFISCPALIRSDFRIESPYNTYFYKGLPPTPISNPGIDAISAARSPVRSNYLYYLSDPRTRQTIFSKTFDEHNANRIKYLH